jgi:predicted aminopeptidase
VGTYHELLPAFRTLMRQERTFVRFYVAVQNLALLDLPQRQQRLQQLSQTVMLHGETNPQTVVVPEAWH